MEKTEHSKHTTIEDEVEITDLPELSASRSHRSSKLSPTMLGWQRSINRRFWRLAGAISTGLLALVALLMIFSSLHNTLTPPPGKPIQYSTPSIHYNYIYRDHPTAMYPGHFDEVLAVAWSPDGTRIASGEHDSTIQVWDTRTGKRLLTYQGHSNQVLALAWSPDGTRIASGSFDNTVQVWDAKTGKRLLTYRGHINTVFSVAWSPDSTRIASGSDDGTVQVWDANTGKRLLTYHGDNNPVLTVAWSPDGTRIVSGSYDGTVQI
jgi:WD40 repeat protein